MADKPHCEAPPQGRESGPAATEAVQFKTDAAPSDKALAEMAWAISPRGELRRYVPKRPAWRRRIGDDVYFGLVLGRPHDSEITMLLGAYRDAVAARDRTEKLAETARRTKATTLPVRRIIPFR